MKIINFLLNNKIDHIISCIIILSYAMLNRKFIVQKIKNIFQYAHLIWYFVLLSLISIYCISHWNDVISFSPFSGNSLLFIVMICLLLLPFVIEVNIGDNRGIIRNPFDVFEKQKELYVASSETENIIGGEGEIKIRDELLQNIEKLAKDKGVGQC